MNKKEQALLLIVVIALGAGARLTILGWLFMYSFGSVFIFGFIHLFIHLRAMNYYVDAKPKELSLLFLSHLSYLGLFFFQNESDDRVTYLILEYTLGIESSFISNHSVSFFFLSLLVYTIVNIIILKKAKRKQSVKVGLLPSLSIIAATMFFTYIFYNSFIVHIEFMKRMHSENKGTFNFVKRADKYPDLVEKINIFPKRVVLKRFPDAILKYPNLKFINLSYHDITTLPEEIYTLENLEILNLQGNQFTEIPESICYCEKLKELRISGSIKKIPDCLKEMNTLHHLHIESPYVNDFIDELYEFKYLETVYFKHSDDIFKLDKESYIEALLENGLKEKHL